MDAWSSRREWIACLVLAIGVLGCEPSRDVDLEEERFDGAPQTDDADADRPRWEMACDRVLEPLDGDRARLQDMDVVEALEALGELSRIQSALSVPRMSEELERFDQMVIFAPLDGGMPADRAAEAEDGGAAIPGDVDAGVAPPESFVSPGGALLLDELVDAGEVEVADGGVVTLDREDDRVLVGRGDAQVEVVCADLEARDAVIHVLSGEPYDVDDDGPLEPGTDTDRDVLAPDVDERLDELDGDPGVGGTGGP